jgi:hypothetical protein
MNLTDAKGIEQRAGQRPSGRETGVGDGVRGVGGLAARSMADGRFSQTAGGALDDHALVQAGARQDTIS